MPLCVVSHDGVITDHCLGLLTTLTGLNIRGNPLEFPPLEVRNKGSRMVLTFLKAVLEAKLSGQPEPEPTGECVHHVHSTVRIQVCTFTCTCMHTNTHVYKHIV